MNNSMDLIGVLLMVASIILIAAGYFWKEQEGDKMGNLIQLYFTIQSIRFLVGFGVLIILAIVLVIWHFID